MPGATLPLIEQLPVGTDAWHVFNRLLSVPHVAFLDSSFVHPTLGRYSFLTGDPFEWFVFRGGESDADGLQWLKQRLSQFASPTVPGLPPFQGGAIAAFSYDLCHRFERLPRPPHDEFKVPDLAVGLYDWVIAFDHLLQRSWVISTGLPEDSPRPRQRRAAERLRDVLSMINGPAPAMATIDLKPREVIAQWPVANWLGVTSNFSRDSFLEAAARAVEYTHAGDVFQVNLAQRLLAPARGSPVDLYHRLRTRNPSPFGGYFDGGDWILASASPERFLRIDDRQVETRPIKGTRPRGITAESDANQRRSLQLSAKDRAENVMIVDLMRNDLGRVCEFGTVNVPALCQVESYQFVHHLVSQVCGRLRPECGPIDLLQAAFPGGSVTGAPKIRAMEIIAELEPTARGFYCGSLGYIGFNGQMDTNILIRTFTVADGWLQFPVGGGIVADSVPEAEYAETLHKAEGLLRALAP